MRLNQFLAKHTRLSRRKADEAIEAGRVQVDGVNVSIGQIIDENSQITLDGTSIVPKEVITIALNKPLKTICSREQQGNVPTIYELLPAELHHLTYLGRLDKDTTGLLIMTNDGGLIQEVTHPKYKIPKKYQVQVDKTLSLDHQKQLQNGVKLEDGVSTFKISGKGRDWTVELSEGRNRQIRRTFEALGYHVTKLHRFQIGKLILPDIKPGSFVQIQSEDII